MEEIWKDIPGYEGLYRISNTGRVLVLASGEFLTQRKNKDGYLRVKLWANGKRRFMYVQRLVAVAFVPNPDKLPEVNHKDERKNNNCAENLEWCTHHYNMNYGTRTTRAAITRSRPVVQIKGGVVVKRWESAKAAESDGFDHRHISGCCNGKRRTHKGYEWRFAT